MSRYNAATRPGMRHDTVERRATRPRRLRHDAQQLALECGDMARDIPRDTACDTTERKATIWPGEACDTAPGAPRHGRPSAQRARSLSQGCAPYAPNLVLAQDTVLSHCLGHCS